MGSFGCVCVCGLVCGWLGVCVRVHVTMCASVSAKDALVGPKCVEEMHQVKPNLTC